MGWNSESENISNPKEFWNQKSLGHKNIGPEFIGSTKFKKTILVPKDFWVKTSFIKINQSSVEISREKIPVLQYKFWWKNIWIPNFFLKKLCGLKVGQLLPGQMLPGPIWSWMWYWVGGCGW